MSYVFDVSIRRKPGLSDPEGATTRKALNDLGFSHVSHVAFDRTITVTVDASTIAEAHAQVEEMCNKLLANPVMETYTIRESA